MVPASSALPQRQRDILSVLTGLLFLLGVFGVVMHGMESGDAAREITLPDVQGGVVRATSTTLAITPSPIAFVARDIRVRADFGGTPERIANSVTVRGMKIDSTMYGRQRGETLLMIGSTSIPKEADETFDEFTLGFAYGFQSKVETKTKVTFQGYEARDLMLRMNAGGVAHALLVQLDGRVLEVVVREPSGSEAEYRAFLSTIQLL